MTTATRTLDTGASEAEIRAALKARAELYPKDDPRTVLREAIADFATPLVSPAFDSLLSTDPREPQADGQADDLWTDLRPSEALTLRQLTDAAIERAFAACQTIIFDELTRAGMTFVARHPDAHRSPQA